MPNKAIDISNMDPGIKPGSDFYHYANGGWLTKHPIPDEFSRYGTFDILREENRKLVKQLIEEVAAGRYGSDSHLAAIVGAYFNAGMDTAARNAAGAGPIIEFLNQINSMKDTGALPDMINFLYRNSIPTVFYFYPSPDRENAEMMIANLHQAGMGLAEVEYYRDKDDRSVEIREKYQEYIRDMFILTGKSEDEANRAAVIILEMETMLAGSGMTRLELRDPHKTFNKHTTEELLSEYPGIDWIGLYGALNVGTDGPVNAGQPDFLKTAGKMIREVSLESWKYFLSWRIINGAASFLSESFEERKFRFYGEFLSGKKSMQPLWKRITAATEDALGEAIGRLFVKKYFPPEARQRMLDLVEKLRDSLRDKIIHLPWMSDATREEALVKLDRMRVKIGYPNRWRSWEELEFTADSFYGKSVQAAVFNMQYELEKIGKPVDKDEWHMTPQTVNAYYHPMLNEIVFPAGILQPPFFYKDADDAVNYGAIGVVIGHEMTHGFDDQGRKFDKNGNLNDWWLPEDAERFSERARVLEEQFNRIQIKDDLYANGKLSLGENIADLGGINIAYNALLKAWEENTPDDLTDGFTPAQRFFLSYAHIWANNIRDKEMVRLTMEDVHSLGMNRVNGPLPNVESFHKAFGIQENEPMFLPESDRASIW